MDLILARIDQLEEQARQQAATNQTQAASVARLSSENEDLRRTVEDQDRVIGELSRVSEGFWIWESARGGKEGGRWVYSLEKYTSSVLTVARHAAPPTSLESLPVELIDLVVSLLPRSDQLSFGRCSSRILGRVAHAVYGFETRLNSKTAASFISARVTNSVKYSIRIRSLLLPPKILLSDRWDHPFNLSDLQPLRLISPSCLPLDVDTLRICDQGRQTSIITSWADFLRLVNPVRLNLDGRCSGIWDHASSTPVSFATLSSTDAWTRLKRVNCFGSRSIPILEQNRKAFALAKCVLRREDQEGRGTAEKTGARLKFKVVRRVAAGGELEAVDVHQEEVIRYLDRLPPADATSGKRGAYLRVSLCREIDGELADLD